MRNISRRTAVAGLASTTAAMAFQPAAFAAAKKIYDLVPIKVADGIWMIEGATEYFTQDNGGAIVNCTLIETSAGLVVIDTGPSLRYGVALRNAIAQLSTLGVAAVINTHHHPDHFFGNQVFNQIPIYALEETRKLAETEGDAFSDNMYRLLGDWMRGTEVTPPNKAIASSSLSIGEREFLIYPLEGHTSSDLAILDKKTGTLIAGDLAFLDRAPTTPHANIAKWKESLQQLKAVDAAGIVPGHGIFDRAGNSLNQTTAYLEWLDQSLRTSVTEGLDMVEALESSIPEEFLAMGAMPQEFQRSVAHLYPDLEREILPLTNR